MKPEPMSSPAIVQAVFDYQKQRAVLVLEIAKQANGYLETIDARSKSLIEAIAVIDAKIERLCLRIT